MIKLCVQCKFCNIGQLIETNNLKYAQKKCIGCKKIFRVFKNIRGTYP